MKKSWKRLQVSILRIFLFSLCLNIYAQEDNKPAPNPIENEITQESVQIETNVPFESTEKLQPDTATVESPIEKEEEVQTDQPTPSEQPKVLEEKSEPKDEIVVPEAPELPAPGAPEEQPERELPGDVSDQGEIKGIDTVDLDEPQGNWLFKRIWWERSERKFEKIQKIVSQILESRMSFFAQRADVDKSILDPFYIKIGMEQGELLEKVSDLTKTLEKLREQEGSLTDQQRNFLISLLEEKDKLKQLELDVQAISQLDNEIDIALSKLLEQINRMRSYEGDAWANFKEIARVLNDKKARELFYKIDTSLRNIQAVQEYIQQRFAQHFRQVIDKINEQVGRVKSEIDTLKEKGIDLKKQIEIQEQKPSEEIDVDVEDFDDEDFEPEEAGFISSYIITPITTLFSALSGTVVTVVDYAIEPFRWGYRKVTGEQAPVEEDEEFTQEVDIEVVEPIDASEGA